MPVRRRVAHPVAAPLVVVTLAALLAGCAEGGADVQVAAKVGKSEVSTFQVAEALRRRADLAGLPAEQARRAALDSLVEQEIAAQAARNAGLDKDPSTIQAMELVKREFLARAYQDRLAGQVAAPTLEAIDRFYAEHPARFAERRLFVLQEFALETGVRTSEEMARLIAQVERAVESAPGPDELAARLRATGAALSTRRLAKAPEELTPPQLETLAALAPGKSVVSRAPGLVMVYWLVRAEPAPLDRASATPIITAALLDQQRSARVETAMQDLRRQTQVELSPLLVPAAPASGATAMR